MFTSPASTPPGVSNSRTERGERNRPRSTASSTQPPDQKPERQKQPPSKIDTKYQAVVKQIRDKLKQCDQVHSDRPTFIAEANYIKKAVEDLLIRFNHDGILDWDFGEKWEAIFPAKDDPRSFNNAFKEEIEKIAGRLKAASDALDKIPDNHSVSHGMRDSTKNVSLKKQLKKAIAMGEYSEANALLSKRRRLRTVHVRGSDELRLHIKNKLPYNLKPIPENFESKLTLREDVTRAPRPAPDSSIHVYQLVTSSASSNASTSFSFSSEEVEDEEINLKGTETHLGPEIVPLSPHPLGTPDPRSFPNVPTRLAFVGKTDESSLNSTISDSVHSSDPDISLDPNPPTVKSEADNKPSLDETNKTNIKETQSVLTAVQEETDTEEHTDEPDHDSTANSSVGSFENDDEVSTDSSQHCEEEPQEDPSTKTEEVFNRALEASFSFMTTLDSWKPFKSAIIDLDFEAAESILKEELDSHHSQTDKNSLYQVEKRIDHLKNKGNFDRLKNLQSADEAYKKRRLAMSLLHFESEQDSGNSANNELVSKLARLMLES